MKLVEILAKEMDVWPKGFKDVGQAHKGNLHLPGIGDHVRHTKESYTKASDWACAIVTCAQWQAERDRQKGGEWKRHRGGSKCPVKAGERIEVRFRDGDVSGTDQPELMDWKHENESWDIMKYQILSQPQAEEVEVKEFMSVTEGTFVRGPISLNDEVIYPADPEWHTDQIDGPIKWRDQIVELEAHEEDIQREIASLFKRLNDEGFQLIRQYPSVSADVPGSLSYAEWIDGDIVRCVARDLSCADLTIGKEYTVVTRHGETGVIDDEEDHMCSCLEVGELEFVRRP